MGYYEDELAKIEQRLEKDPLGKAWKEGLSYDFSDGYGYKIFDNSLQKQTMEIIDRADLDKLKKALDNW